MWMGRGIISTASTTGPRDLCDDVPVSGEAGQAGPGGGGAVGRVVMVSLSCVFVQVTLHKLQSNVN